MGQLRCELSDLLILGDGRIKLFEAFLLPSEPILVVPVPLILELFNLEAESLRDTSQ